MRSTRNCNFRSMDRKYFKDLHDGKYIYQQVRLNQPYERLRDSYIFIIVVYLSHATLHETETMVMFPTVL